MRQTGNYLFLLVFLFISLVLMMSIHNIMLMKSVGLCLILGLCTSAYLITRRHRDQLILIPLGILALTVYLTMHTTGEPTALKFLDKLLWLGFSGYLILIVFRQNSYLSIPADPRSRNSLFSLLDIHIIFFPEGKKIRTMRLAFQERQAPASRG